jgi:hypothetical protein
MGALIEFTKEISASKRFNINPLALELTPAEYKS